jgi:hypothetical protein
MEWFARRVLKNSCRRSLPTERSNPIHNEIKYIEITASLTLHAMTGRSEFFRNPLTS